MTTRAAPRQQHSGGRFGLVGSVEWLVHGLPQGRTRIPMASVTRWWKLWSMMTAIAAFAAIPLAPLSALAAPGAAAQLPEQAPVQIEGEVLDGVTGGPVAGVLVHFPDLGIGTITDALGYFVLDSVPSGSQVLATHRAGYEALAQQVPIVPGETWVLRLTPAAIPVEGVEVEAARGEELEALRSGRRSDFLSPGTVADAGQRTNKLLEVLRSKAPPRLQIRQQGGRGGVTFCIQSSRRAPSVQELTDLGIGCHPALLVMDGVLIYAPPAVTEMARMEPPALPADVAALLLNQHPGDVESIRILSRTDAFFRYGEAGRLGAVEIKTKHPGRPRGG